jgi:glutamine synthetase
MLSLATANVSVRYDVMLGTALSLAFHPSDEIPLGPLPALQAIDQLVHAREVVTYIAGINGYRATFHPRPNPAGAASGMHLHSSFEPASKQGAFYAGVLQELPSICAFSLGGLHSYDRVVDGAWSGGTWCAWGHQNRDAALRRIDESDAHWELKAFDGLANPYLAVAAYLTAGRMGVEQNMHLPQPTDGEVVALFLVSLHIILTRQVHLLSVPASNLTPERREVMGIRKALPRTLKEALSTFFSDKGKRTSLIGTLIDPKSRVTQFIQEFGAEPAIRYTQVKEQELALMKQLEPTKRESLSVEQVQMKSRIFMIERY